MEKNKLKLDKKTKERFSRIRRLGQLQAMDPVLFEHYVGYLYQKDGYTAYTTATSGDEGIDLFLRKGTKTAVVQVKRYAGSVGQSVVRDLYGAMIHTKANEAMLVTTGTISRPALKWARGKPIDLVDGHEIMSWSRRASGLGRSGRRWPLWQIVAGGVAMILCLVTAVASVLFAQNMFANRTTAVLPSPSPVVVTTDVLPSPPPVVVTTAVSQLPAGDSTPTLAATLPVVMATVTLPPSPYPHLDVLRTLSELSIDADLSDWDTSSHLNVPRMLSAPRIDADLSDWDTSRQPVAVTHITEQQDTWDGSMDIESLWWLGWDDANLYLAVQVTDNTHVQAEVAQFAYWGDSLELQFDTDIQSDYEPLVNDDDFQYILSPGNFGSIPPGLWRFVGDGALKMFSDFTGSEARIAAKQTKTGYVLETAVPWSDMNMMPQPGLTIGVALSINDNDTPGSQQQQELALSHVASRLWLDPTSWGTMTLLP